MRERDNLVREAVLVMYASEIGEGTRGKGYGGEGRRRGERYVQSEKDEADRRFVLVWCACHEEEKEE